MWKWVNGCDICNQKVERFGCYIRCDEHDRCCNCNKKRSDIKETVYGHLKGFECVACYKTRRDIEKAEALTRVTKEYDAFDYSCLDEIKCPYCDTLYGEDHDHYDSEDYELKCDMCENKFLVTAHHSVTFEVKRKD